MSTEYIDEALMRAHHALIDDPGRPRFGEIPDVPGAWASADKRVRQGGVAWDQWMRD